MDNRLIQGRNEFAEASNRSKMDRKGGWRSLRVVASVLKFGLLVLTVAIVAGWIWSWSEPRNAVGNWYREEEGGRIVRTICGARFEYGVICVKWDRWCTDLDLLPQWSATEERENIAASYKAMGGWKFSRRYWEFTKPSKIVVSDGGGYLPPPPVQQESLGFILLTAQTHKIPGRLERRSGPLCWCAGLGRGFRWRFGCARNGGES
jgi:hypothetical protein